MTNGTPAARIFLIDDHTILRTGLRMVLEQQPDFEVVGEAEDGRTGVEQALALHADVVLMDIAMPHLNGIDATRRILQLAPQTNVVALTAYSEPNVVRETLNAGATGFVIKDSAVEELVDCVRTVLSGRSYLSPRVASDLVQGFAKDPAEGNGGAAGGVFRRLTLREREVLQLLAEGKATKEVAAALKVSVKTAETHRRSVMEKLDVDSIAKLTKYAIRQGLTTADA